MYERPIVRAFDNRRTKPCGSPVVLVHAGGSVWRAVRDAARLLCCRAADSGPTAVDAGWILCLVRSDPTCTPPGQPRDGTSVNTVVALTKEGGEWVARSAPGMGSVELRLKGTGKSVRGYVVSGTVTGSARDMGLMGVVRDVSVSVGSSTSGGSATFDGETASPSSSLIVGKVTGTVRFSDSQGQSSTCSQIQWSMQPY